MNFTLKENGLVLATITNKKVTCDDNRVRECLEALITNHEMNHFPAHIDKDLMLEEAIKAFAMVNSYEVV